MVYIIMVIFLIYLLFYMRVFMVEVEQVSSGTACNLCISNKPFLLKVPFSVESSRIFRFSYRSNKIFPHTFLLVFPGYLMPEFCFLCIDPQQTVFQLYFIVKFLV